jgi:abequosyltransferase
LNPDRPRLLTIAIPTYNRSLFLDRCLEQICKQLPGCEGDVEVMVSDNCSTDDTADVVRRHQARGASIVYRRNEENIGSDRNIAQCYQLAKSNYVLVLGDDDLLLDGALAKIQRVLATGPFGVVYVDGYGFDSDHLREAPRRSRTPRLLVYEDRESFADRVNYYFTFVSGNIVNTTFIDSQIRIEDFLETHLGQTVFILSAMFGAPRNAFVDDDVIAARNNQGARYDLCQVFGANLNQVLAHFRSAPEGEACIRVINRNLLVSFFPGILYAVRAGTMKFLDVDPFAVLRKVYRRNPLFWLLAAPILVLPLPLAHLWLQFAKVARRVANGIRRFNDRPEVIDLAAPAATSEPT